MEAPSLKSVQMPATVSRRDVGREKEVCRRGESTFLSKTGGGPLPIAPKLLPQTGVSVAGLSRVNPASGQSCGAVQKSLNREGNIKSWFAGLNYQFVNTAHSDAKSLYELQFSSITKACKETPY